MADYGDELLTPAIPDPRFAQADDILRAMKEWIEVRQGARGDGLDRAVTLRDLLNTGMATPESLALLANPPAGIALPPGQAEPDVPPTPQNLNAAGALSTIVLTWDFARGYSRLAYFEVWRSQDNVVGNAVKVGQAFSPIYADEVGSNAKFYYWIKAVSDMGTSPFNAVAGTLGETTISVAEVQDAIQDSINLSGLLDQLTIKQTVDGLVSGYGLASTPTLDDGRATTFAILASRFLVAAPLVEGITASSPFLVQTVPTTLNGVAVPRGVYMTDAYLMNGVITTAKIGLLQVDDARIASVSVSKLTAGSISVGEYIESTGFQSGTSGFRIGGDGNAEFNNATLRGAVYASGGNIGGNLITSDGIQSVGYNASTAGWRIASDGTVEFNEGVFRGALAAASGTFKGALVAATGTFSGALVAATGTFSGQVKGGSFATGAYSSYAWPPAGQWGTYMDGNGLLMGNANSGRYVQITSTGDIYTPGFQVVGGVMTVHAANVIDTLNIRGNAVSSTAFVGGNPTFYLSTPVAATVCVIVRGYYRADREGYNCNVLVNGVVVATSERYQAYAGSSGGDNDTAFYVTKWDTDVGSINVGPGTVTIQVGQAFGPAPGRCLVFLMKR